MSVKKSISEKGINSSNKCFNPMAEKTSPDTIAICGRVIVGSFASVRLNDDVKLITNMLMGMHNVDICGSKNTPNDGIESDMV